MVGISMSAYLCEMSDSASSEAPKNLLQLLLPVWSEVVDTVVTVNSQNITFCVEQNDDSTATKQTRLLKFVIILKIFF